MIHIGVDLGKNGAIFAYDRSVNIIHAIHPIPVGSKLYSSVYDLGHDGDPFLTYEIPIIMGKITSKKSYGFMRWQEGQLVMACEALGVPYEGVRPADWSREIFRGVKRPSGSADKKRQSIQKALQLYPALRDRYPKGLPDGLAEACLIARYGKMRAGGG